MDRATRRTIAGLTATLHAHTDDPATGRCRHCGRRYCPPYAEARAELSYLGVDVAAELEHMRARAVPRWADLIAHTVQGVLMATLLGVAMLPAAPPAGAELWTFETSQR